MTAIREDFPILENQILRNSLQKIIGQSNYSFEEFAMLWALSAISKDANEYVNLTLRLLRSSNKHNYVINKASFLYNLQWHLTGVYEIIIANRVANELLKLAKEEVVPAKSFKFALNCFKINCHDFISFNFYYYYF